MLITTEKVNNGVIQIDSKDLPEIVARSQVKRYRLEAEAAVEFDIESAFGWYECNPRNQFLNPRSG